MLGYLEIGKHGCGGNEASNSDSAGAEKGEIAVVYMDRLYYHIRSSGEIIVVGWLENSDLALLS